MKRLASLLSLSLLATLLAAGCGENPKPDATNTSNQKKSGKKEEVNNSSNNNNNSSNTTPVSNDPLDRYDDGEAIEQLDNLYVFPPRPLSCSASTTTPSSYVLPFALKSGVFKGGTVVNNALSPGDIYWTKKLIPEYTFGSGNLFLDQITLQPFAGSIVDYITHGAKCPAVACPAGLLCAPAGATPTASAPPVYQCVKPSEAFLKPGSLKFLSFEPKAAKKEKVLSIAIVPRSGLLNAFSNVGTSKLNYGSHEIGLLRNLLHDTSEGLITELNFITGGKSIPVRITIPERSLGGTYTTISCTNPKKNLSGAIENPSSNCKPLTTGTFHELIDASNTDFWEAVKFNDSHVNETNTAIAQAIKNLEDSSDKDRFLVVFTGGPDNAFNVETEASKLAASLKEKHIRTAILHFDEKRDPTTISGNKFDCEVAGRSGGWAATCSNGDCAPNEECRALDITSCPSSRVQRPKNPTDKFCRPKLDADGYLGPDVHYAQIACESEGFYYYFNKSKEARLPVNALAYAMFSLFSVQVEVPHVTTTITKGYFGRFSGLILANYMNSVLTSVHSAPREVSSKIYSEDTRFTLYRP